MKRLVAYDYGLEVSENSSAEIACLVLC